MNLLGLYEMHVRQYGGWSPSITLLEATTSQAGAVSFMWQRMLTYHTLLLTGPRYTLKISMCLGIQVVYGLLSQLGDKPEVLEGDDVMDPLKGCPLARSTRDGVCTELPLATELPACCTKGK
jgi:hypothetical protein